MNAPDRLRLALAVAVIKSKPSAYSVHEYIDLLSQQCQMDADMLLMHAVARKCINADESDALVSVWTRLRHRAVFAEHEVSRLRHHLQALQEGSASDLIPLATLDERVQEFRDTPNAEDREARMGMVTLVRLFARYMRAHDPILKTVCRELIQGCDDAVCTDLRGSSPQYASEIEQRIHHATRIMMTVMQCGDADVNKAVGRAVVGWIRLICGRLDEVIRMDLEVQGTEYQSILALFKQRLPDFLKGTVLQNRDILEIVPGSLMTVLLEFVGKFAKNDGEIDEDADFNTVVVMDAMTPLLDLLEHVLSVLPDVPQDVRASGQVLLNMLPSCWHLLEHHFHRLWQFGEMSTRP